LALRFERSAHRHGISVGRARFVVEHCPSPIHGEDPWGDDLVFFLGPDQDGVPLEIAALVRSPDDLVVIHAMPLRRRFLRDYREVMRWHER